MMSVNFCLDAAMRGKTAWADTKFERSMQREMLDDSCVGGLHLTNIKGEVRRRNEERNNG